RTQTSPYNPDRSKTPRDHEASADSCLPLLSRSPAIPTATLAAHPNQTRALRMVWIVAVPARRRSRPSLEHAVRWSGSWQRKRREATRTTRLRQRVSVSFDAGRAEIPSRPRGPARQSGAGLPGDRAEGDRSQAIGRSPRRADDVRLRDSARVIAGIEQLPLPLGDDVDGATDHFDRGLVVDCVRRNRQTGRPE